MFSSSIHHYIIWSDKCYLLVHIVVEIHLFGNLDDMSLSPSATSSPSPWFNDETLVSELASIVHFPRILQCHLDNLCCTSLLRHPESAIWRQSELDLGQIWWLEHIPKIYNISLWPDKVRSYLAHLAGGPAVMVSFLTRLTILPWGNCKTYSISCSWWILFVSKVWSSPVDHVNAISKHVYGTPIFNRNIWSPMLNISSSIIQTPLYG